MINTPGFDAAYERFAEGTVIPAIPLALNEARHFDRQRQRALIQYYLASGAGGIAAGVHTTQFQIRDQEYNLFEPVLQSISGFIDDYVLKNKKPIFKIGGICGKTDQAVKEARFLAASGYHAGLVSLSAFKNEAIEVMLRHCEKIASEIPIIGFYLQPLAGGVVLPYEFWKKFCQIENVIGIKIAPFNRYRTLDVIRAVAESERQNKITLYTGNDDSIVYDLASTFKMPSAEGEQVLEIKGGLLGQWSVWTSKAVELFEAIRRIKKNNKSIPQWLFQYAQRLTDANAAIFDAANDFSGCIPGIHEILRRQGLLEGIWCLRKDENLSPGQKEAIDRVCTAYPELQDDEFVKKNLSTWLEETS